MNVTTVTLRRRLVTAVLCDLGATIVLIIVADASFASVLETRSLQATAIVGVVLAIASVGLTLTALCAMRPSRLTIRASTALLLTGLAVNTTGSLAVAISGHGGLGALALILLLGGNALSALYLVTIRQVFAFTGGS